MVFTFALMLALGAIYATKVAYDRWQDFVVDRAIASLDKPDVPETTPTQE